MPPPGWLGEVTRAGRLSRGCGGLALGGLLLGFLSFPSSEPAEWGGPAVADGHLSLLRFLKSFLCNLLLFSVASAIDISWLS